MSWINELIGDINPDLRAYKSLVQCRLILLSFMSIIKEKTVKIRSQGQVIMTMITVIVHFTIYYKYYELNIMLTSVTSKNV